MSDYSILLDKINKKDQEIQLLEEKLKAARVYVQALRDALSFIQPKLNGVAFKTDEAELRPGSVAGMAREAILKAGRPLHADELLEILEKPPGRESRQSLSSALAAYVRRGEIFTRTAPNTFSLFALGHVPNEEVDQLPDTFGDE